MINQIGKQKRMDRILARKGKAFIVPVDDLLISGTEKHLENYQEKIRQLEQLPIDAVLGFPGVFSQFYNELHGKAWILNLTTSTIRSDHTRKRLSLTLKNAISMGCDAVAVHVNVSDPAEGEMIQNLAVVACECQEYGIPLMAIVYARSVGGQGADNNYLILKEEDNEAYTALIAHACRIAVELGADIIKTNFTGSIESFQRVICAAGDVPVIIAGGSIVSEKDSLAYVRRALRAGAAGICFGRNFFSRENYESFCAKVGELFNEYT